jgi:site-specific DNA recombinase
VSDTKARNREDVYSLNEQEAMTLTYCQEHGFEDTGSCREIHTGGELDERPEMSRVRSMIRRREIDVLVLINLDRLARNQNHQEVFLYECAKYGIQVELTSEVYEDTPVGRHMRSLAGFVAEIEREKIRERTQRGIRGRIKLGKLMPGVRPLYGYKWSDPGKGRKESYVINHETAPVVQRIYHEAAEGKKLRRIAIDLTNEGILSPSDYWRREQGRPIQGVPWQKSAVWRILDNPSYYGQHSANKTESAKRKYFNEYGEPVSQSYRIEHAIDDGHRISQPDVCPQIISDPLARAVQQLLTENKTASTRRNSHPEATLLRGGFVKCGHCGHNLRVAYYRDDSKQQVIAYRCHRPKDRLSGVGECRGCQIRADGLDDKIWTWLLEVIRNPKIIEAQLNTEEQTGYASTIEGYHSRIAGLEIQQKRLSHALGMLDESEQEPILAQYRVVGQDKADAERELAVLLERQSDFDTWREKMSELKLLADAAQTMDWTYERKRQALFAYNVQIQVWRSGEPLRWQGRIVRRKPNHSVPSDKPDGHAEETLAVIRADAAASA